MEKRGCQQYIIEKCYIEMAIKGTITNQNIKYLEARITPKKNALENKKIIEKYEKIIGNRNRMQSFI